MVASRSWQAMPMWSMRVSTSLPPDPLTRPDERPGLLGIVAGVAAEPLWRSCMPSNSVIVAGARTPIGRLLGSLKDHAAVDLGGIAIKAALERAGVSGDQVDYV